MKTAQDFHENYNQFDAQIEKEIENLNRMRKEHQANGAVAQQIINDLEPVLEKLHLTIGEFTMNHPNKEKVSNRGTLNLTLHSDGKFKFISLKSFSNKDYNRLDEKAEKIEMKVVEALQTQKNELYCSVNQYSLEIRGEETSKSVLMTISYNF